MNINNPQEKLNELTESIITDIMCMTQLNPHFQATVYIAEEGDYPIYTRYVVQNFLYNKNHHPFCEGISQQTNELRSICLFEINNECLINIHMTLSNRLNQMPFSFTEYTFEDILGDVMILKKEKLYYLFTINGTKYFEPVKEGEIIYSLPLATYKSYTIKFQRNCVEGFCVFKGNKHLESFWHYNAALQFIRQFVD